jgi:1-phosphatidylinositol-3-phosphate 5-kinase
LEVIEKYASSSADSFPVSPTVDEEDEVDDLATTTEQQPMEISFENAPQPTPMMAIPATKKGESLEIFPSSNNNSPRAPNSRIRPSSLSQNRNRRRAATIDGTGQRSGLHNLNNHLSISGDEEVVASDDDRLGTASDVPEHTHDESEEEDEQAMSLFTALNSAKVDVDQRSETNSRSNFLRPRSGTARSVDQGKTSLMRIGQRRKTFSSNGRRITLSRSKSTMNPDRLPLSAGSSPKKGGSANGKMPQISGPPARKPMSSNVAQAPSIDLNKASINHAKAFLDQLLWNFELSAKWNAVLVEPLLQCAQNIDLNVKGGDSIDIRHYVKLKRIPAGTLKDTRYVDGIVFSKSLALKSMPRTIDDPKILLITFPIEYSRAGNHFMSLDPVIAQETEYLRKLVRRITTLRPDVILAGDRVSGIALKMLDDHGIAVATGVKSTVINRVARYTQADIISSIDKLAMNPTVGRCLRFEVNTYRYKDMVKTFMFFSGIPKELGCTILLRGSDAATLAKVKAVTEFMVYVVFNLKLETSLMRDEFVLIPSQDPHERHYVSPHGKNHGIEADTGYFHDLLKMQAKKIMSSSPFVHFGNPYFFQEARDLEDRLVEMSKENEALDLSDEAIINEAYLKLNLNRSLEELPGGSTYAQELIKAVNNEKYQRIHEQWTVQKRQWEQMYAQFPDMFDPSSHQNIVVLFSIICNETATPCVGPEKMTIDFYSENDATLGQFVEHICETTEDGCPDECGRPLNGHYRSYVHGRGRINVIVEKLQSRLPGYQDTILMWSYCKECKNTTPIMPMSGTTWKYSFGKYLELSFWSDGLSFRAGVCDHDIYRDHIRYFGFHDMAVRFEYDSIGLLEVVAPKAKVAWDPEKEICHKLEIYDSVVNKVNRFWGSVANRLNNVIIEGLDPEKIEECKAKVEELRARCEEERVEVIDMVKHIYLSSRIADFLPLNGALRTIQDKVVTWDNEFIQFENNYLPSEKDVARITAQQLKKIFVDKQDETTPELVETPASEKDMRDMKADVTPPISSASSAIGKDEKTAKKEAEDGTGSPKVTDTVSEHASPKESVDYVGQRGSQSTDCLPSQSIHATAGPDKDGSQPASKLPVSKLKEPTSVSEPVSRVSSPKRESPGRVREEVSRVEENLSKNQSQRKDEGYFFRKPTLDRVPRLPTTPELEIPLPIEPDESRTSPLAESFNRAGQNKRTPEELYRQPIPHEKVRDSSIPTLRTDKLDQRRGLRQRSDSSTENNKSHRASSNGSARSEDTKAITRSGRSSEESTRIVDSKVRATPVQSMRSDKSYGRQTDKDTKRKAWNEGGTSQNPSLSFRKRFSDKISFPAQTLRQRFGTSTKELEKQLLKNRQPGQTKVSSLAKHFDQLSREFEKERAKERNLMEQGRIKAFPVARARPIVEVFKNVEDAVEELSDNDDDKKPNITNSVPQRIGTSNEGVRYRPPPKDIKKEEQEEEESNAEESHSVQTEDDQQEADRDTSLSNSQTSETLHESAETRSNSEIGTIPEKEPTDHTAEKQTLMQTLARFWADRTSSGWASLDYPMNPTEHIFADSDIIIREDEPSSLIAFCLNSPDYLEKLKNMGQSNNPPHKQAVELDELVPENASTYINETDSALESQMLKKTGIHLKYQFQEGSANLSCKIFFSEQFDAFRKQCGCDDHYVQSLSRCVKWDSSGGKSGSAFLKTLDDRLVVKQLSQSELDAFVKFAPSYFEYMAQAFFHVVSIFLETPRIRWDRRFWVRNDSVLTYNISFQRFWQRFLDFIRFKFEIP